MPKKPPLATVEALEATEERLKTQIVSVNNLIHPTVNAAETRCNEKITETLGKLTAAENTSAEAVKAARNDAKEFTKETTKALNAQLLEKFPVIEDRITKTKEFLEATIENVDTMLRDALASEIKGLCDAMLGEIQGLREDLEHQIETRREEAAQNLENQRLQLTARIEAERKEAADNDDANMKAVSERFEQTIENQRKADAEQDAKNLRAQNEIHLELTQLGQRLDDFRQEAANERQRRADVAAQELDDANKAAQARLNFLEDEARRMRGAMSEVENYSTRRVEWVIQKASKCIRPASPSKSSLHSSWFSPKFDAAGAYGLQLELQRFRATDPPVDGQEAGDLAVYLWACKGTTIVYRLFIGDRVSASIEKKFNGRVPYGTERICFFRDQVNKEENTLRVGVEILELKRELEHVVRKPVPVEGKEVEPPPVSNLTPEGSILFSRSINFRVAEEVEHQIELMKSRMIRKIEWRLEHASMLPRSFPKGHAICSLPFNAAGVEGVQLVFYPTGYSGAADGFCSLFIYGPAGATLRCWLWAGNKKRETSHAFEEPGAFGRTNFCLYESIIDEMTDSILLMLEIEDAQQDIIAATAHPVPVAGDTRTQDEIEGKSPTPKAFNSVVKMTRQMGKGVNTAANASKFEDVKALPSLWTSLGAAEERHPAGYRSFDVLSGRSKPSSGHRSPAGASAAAGGAGMHRHESAPTLQEHGGTSAMQQDLFTPSDRDLPGIAHAAGARKAPRRARPRSGGSHSMAKTFTNFAS